MGRVGASRVRGETIRHRSGTTSRTILALEQQDTDPSGLHPPRGIEILGTSSDHLITDSGRCCLGIGAEITFQLSVSALLRAMTSPFVANRPSTAR